MGSAIAVGGLVAVGLGVWWLSQNISGVNRPDAAVTTVNLLPPPPPAPPPPPPPPEKPPEPDKVVQTPKPQEASADQPKQLTIAGPAQAGGDAFGIRAGAGGGQTIGGGPSDGAGGGGGGGFAQASYGRFLSSEIQQVVQSDDHVNRQVFTADVAVWVDGGGRLTRARILRTSGDGKLDHVLVATLEGMRALGEPPPAAFKFPQRVTIRGRRA